MPIQPTPNYLDQTTAQTQNVVVVVQIAGVSDLLTSTHLEVPIAYGDPITYGQAGLTYGQLRSYGGAATPRYREILDISGSSLTISQRVEPEQGRASVSQLSLSFIDKDGFMTALCAPGQTAEIVYGDGHVYGGGEAYGDYVVSGPTGAPTARSGFSQSPYPPDLLGAEVNVYIGYQGLAFPTDYLQIFRGYIGQYSSQAGKVVLQLSDPNVKRRQTFFQTETTTLGADINTSATTIQLGSTGSAYERVLGPDGVTYDSGVVLYVQIDDEIISYTTVDSTTQISGGARAQQGTTAAAHVTGATVSYLIQISDHAIDMALKLMLSGWDDYFATGATCSTVGTVTTSTIILPTGIDAKQAYGLTEGDWVTVTGSPLGNNGLYQITAITPYSGTYNNRIDVTPAFPSPETGATVLMAFRSQYDTYPVLAGLRLSPVDVDVDQHLFIKQAFLGGNANSYRFVIDSEQNGKTFLESQIYLPFSMYSLTSRGRLSVNLTHPPIGGETLFVFNEDNVLNPQGIQVVRGTNTRKFFNTIVYNFDYNLLTQLYETTIVADSPNSVGQIGFTGTLPINSNGARSGPPNDTDLSFSSKADQLLSRYQYGAIQLSLTTNYGTGNLVEAGDVVAVQDGGDLQISNFTTGSRNLGTSFFEVEDRKFDIKAGRVSYSLISGVGGQVTDRFGLISPSSQLASATTTTITIEPSFGNLYNEQKKWAPYIGQQVLIHNIDYTQSQEVTLKSQDPTNLNLFTVNPALTITLTGLYMDIATYSTSADPSVGRIYKLAYCYTDPQVSVATGVSPMQFTVAGGDASKFLAGQPIIVHTVDYSTASPEVMVLSVSGTTITTSSSLGFTPNSTYYVDLIGFANDAGSPYRYYVT